MGVFSATGTFLARAVRAINRGGLVVACASLAFMTLAVSFEAIARYFFNAPTRWAFEGAQFALGVSIFLAGGYILEQERHVRMDLLTGRLRERVRAGLFLAVYPLGLTFSVVLLYMGLSGVRWSIDLGARTPSLHMLIAIPQAAVPLGALLLSVTFIYRWFQLLAVVRGRGGAASPEGKH